MGRALRVHERWTTRLWPEYLDPNVDDRPEWPDFVDAIRNGCRVILTKSHVPSREGEPWRRKSYIALWRVVDVEVADGQLTFKFVEQLHRFQ